ncbi:hypothetical protein [Stappia sp. MMSF_3263]|uniref:hypothetical protein n=1 Tax=Stappia sp. MMSF_3263 TaxID=3046693 RepID=UPI00273D7F02|nr:hypothetical protein [Stappia sp. MMSF_3263]
MTAQVTAEAPAPLDKARLGAAVGAGILTWPQAERLADFWIAPVPAGTDESVSHADAEEVRFARGFHDVFISIGIVILLFGLWFALRYSEPLALVYPGPLVLPAGAVALAIWGLSEVFARRKRLALPSFILTIAFAPAFLAACIGLATGALSLNLVFAQEPGSPLLILPTLLGIGGGALHYWRFRVPVGVAVVAATVFFLVAVLVEVAAPGALEAHTAWFTLAAGLAAFLAAMRYDARDPKRVTVASDKAFWLHLLAAPLMVHSILALTTAGVSELGQGDAVIVIALFAALAFVAIVVDRRAILVSGLGYFGVAIGTLMAEADISGSTATSVTLVLLGCFILLLGSAWRAVRRTLGKPLNGTSLARLVPAFD